MNIGQGQAPQQININPEDTEPVICDKCESQLFIPTYMLRKVSALISPSGREEVIQVPVMVCFGCGQPLMGDEPAEEENDGSTIIGA